MFFVQQAYSQQPVISWTADTAPVTGYTVYYGPSTGNYTSNVPVGNTTTYTFQNISTTTHIALTASNSSGAQSGYSPELVIQPLTASAGSGGSISPSGSFFVSQGANQTFTITPAAGYAVSSVLVDGVSVGAVTSYTLSNVSGGHTVSATFAANANKPASYTITAAACSNGTISPSGSTTVASGGSQTYTITAATGYKISSVLVDGVSVGAVGSYTFSSVAANHTISATFASSTTSYTITASASTKGTISPSGAVKVSSGGSQTFTFTPASSCRVSSVLVDGKSIGAVSSYTFSNVVANHTISAVFVSGRSYTSSSPTTALSSQVASVPVVADAGPQQTVAPGATVTLSGSNSSDTGGPGIASHLWTQVSGSPVSLSKPSAATTTFTAPQVQSGEALTFQLTVTDRKGLKATDTCIVNVTSGSGAPSAQAGTDQTVSELTIVTLDGSESTDPDNAISSYSWQQVDGPTVALSNANSPQPTFVAPLAESGYAALSFKLTVTNVSGLQSTDTCFVNITSDEATPKAVAGTAKTATAGSTVKLSGTGSSDSGIIASLQWRQVVGEPVTLSKPTSATPSFVAKKPVQYDNKLTFGLIVKDANGLRSRATQVITVK